MQKATLVMESRGFAAQVRSTKLSNLWSRLYRAEGILLDMSCRPEGSGLRLQGQVLNAENTDKPLKGEISLYQDNQVFRTELDAAGGFGFSLDAGYYRLEAKLAETSLEINPFHLD